MAPSGKLPLLARLVFAIPSCFFSLSKALVSCNQTEVAAVNVFAAAVVFLLNKQLESDNFLPLHMAAWRKLSYFFRQAGKRNHTQPLESFAQIQPAS